MNTFEATLITKLPSIYILYSIEGDLFSLYTVQTSGNLVEFLFKVKLDFKITFFFFLKFLFKFQKGASRYVTHVGSQIKRQTQNFKVSFYCYYFHSLVQTRMNVCDALLRLSCISNRFGYCVPILFLPNSQILLGNAKAYFPN